MDRKLFVSRETKVVIKFEKVEIELAKEIIKK